MSKTLTLAPATVDPRSHPVLETELVELQRELLGYFEVMKEWAEGDLGLAFQQLSGFSARASELRGLLNRSSARSAQTFRTKQIDPFLEECDRQFRTLSRIQAIRQFDWDMAKGGT